MTESNATRVTWEAFCDVSYYDMWCVRQVGECTFGQGFHVIRQDEAEALRDLLNTRTAAEAASRAEVERLRACAEDATKALPVLITMLKTAKLGRGANVAIAMLDDVRAALSPTASGEAA